MGDSRPEPLRLQFDVRIRLEFHGSKIPSDAGLLAFRELDERSGLSAVAAQHLTDLRTGRNVQHDLPPLLRPSVYSRLAGYPDTNDADRLAHHPAMRLVVGRRASEKRAAARNTLGRFETQMLATGKNPQGLASLNRAWVSTAMAHTPTQRLILDLDSSESPVHGKQEGARYNLPANTVLQRQIEPYLERPGEVRLRHPVVAYHDFLYLAGTWGKPRRVVCKIEGHAGELFPRVGFSVTNPTDPPQGIVHFYNGRLDRLERIGGLVPVPFVTAVRGAQ
jgi:hypothetical protein